MSAGVHYCSISCLVPVVRSGNSMRSKVIVSRLRNYPRSCVFNINFAARAALFPSDRTCLRSDVQQLSFLQLLRSCLNLGQVNRTWAIVCSPRRHSHAPFSAIFLPWRKCLKPICPVRIWVIIDERGWTSLAWISRVFLDVCLQHQRVHGHECPVASSLPTAWGFALSVSL